MFPLSFTPLQKQAAPAVFATSSEPTPAQKVAQNLLAHIPGEASGFYLMGLEIQGVSKALLFFLALLILLVVRWLGRASLGVLVTSLLAYLLWMGILDDGYLNDLPLFDWLDDANGLVVALAYSLLVTALASAGKIR